MTPTLDGLTATKRSPLRYPGGKTRAVSIIKQYLPSGISALASPFLGGASVELACAAEGIQVFGSDAFQPLANFWHWALTDAPALAFRAAGYLPLSRDDFYMMQRQLGEMPNGLERAAWFYVLNRSSFSGTTLSGGMSPGHPRFTETAVKRLRQFYNPNISVWCLDYEQALSGLRSGVFVYCDPPYDLEAGSGLYGTGGDMHCAFDHDRLAEVLRERDGWVLSYNDTERIRRLYTDYRIVVPDWKYGMSRDKKSREVLIINS